MRTESCSLSAVVTGTLTCRDTPACPPGKGEPGTSQPVAGSTSPSTLAERLRKDGLQERLNSLERELVRKAAQRRVRFGISAALTAILSSIWEVLGCPPDFSQLLELPGCEEGLFSIACLGAFSEEERQGAVEVLSCNMLVSDRDGRTWQEQLGGIFPGEPAMTSSDGPLVQKRTRACGRIWWEWASGVLEREEERAVSGLISGKLDELEAHPETQEQVLVDAGGALMEAVLAWNAGSPRYGEMKMLFLKVLAAREVAGMDYALDALAAGVPSEFILCP